MKNEKQLKLFDDTPSKDTTLGGDPDNKYSQRKKRGDLPGQRFLLPKWNPTDSVCGKCNAPIRKLDLGGGSVWLDLRSVKPAGKGASTARLHKEVCF